MIIAIGIEGAVLAGKSTIIGALKKWLLLRNVPCVTASDFVQSADELGLPLPVLSPTTVDEELAAVDFFLTVDQLRRPSAREGVILLDRTCLTLAAHSFALAAIGGVKAFKQVRRRIDEAGLIPNHLIYLDVSNQAQLQRAHIRGQLPEPLLDAKFNNAFRQFFSETQYWHSAVWVNADNNFDNVFANAEEQIVRWLGNRIDEKG